MDGERVERPPPARLIGGNHNLKLDKSDETVIFWPQRNRLEARGGMRTDPHIQVSGEVIERSRLLRQEVALSGKCRQRGCWCKVISY